MIKSVLMHRSSSSAHLRPVVDHPLADPSPADASDEGLQMRPLSPTSSSQSSHSPVAGMLPYDRFSEWVYCLCVVTFDIELGQAMEQVFPQHVKLTDREKTNICYLSFPDSNSGCMGDTQFHFRTRMQQQLPDGFNHPLNAYNDNCLPCLRAEKDFLYGYVYFRQIRDRSAKRGYFQKSVVLLTRLPFVTLFKTVVSLLANEYFDQGDSVIHSACRDIDHWPELKAGSTPKLPLLSTTIQCRIPDKTESLHDPSSGNGIYHTMSTISSSSSSNPLSSSTSSSNGQDKTASGSSFLLLEAAPIKNGSFGSLHSPSKSASFTRGFTASPTILIPSLNQVNLFKCFFPILKDLQTLWELVITCEPVIVMAPTPDITCEVVEALVASIWPLTYAGDYRPFFTIHDSEFKEFTSTTHSPPPSIIGVTNPFFAKALQHWPHIIRIGDFSSPLSPQKSSLKRNGLLKSLDCSPGVHTNGKTLLQKDRVILKKICKGMENQRPAEVQSALIKSYFQELTQSFLMPLERYLTSLMPLQRSVSPYKSAPLMQPFNPDDFFKLLDISGPQQTSGIKGDWNSLYRKFFRCANFHFWYENRCQEVNDQLNQIHIRAILNADLLSYVRDKSEVEVVDLVLTLKDKIKSLNGKVSQQETIQQLTSLVKAIVKVLPPDLHPIMNKK